MKDLIKKILKEETEKVLEIPGLHYFPDGINGLKKFIEKKNIKRWSLDDKLYLAYYYGDITWIEGLVSITSFLNLSGTQIKSLPNLKSVGNFLSLIDTPIESLENLISVGGYLNIRGTELESLPKLQSVGGNLYLNEYFSEKYTDEEIRNIINVGGGILRP